MLQALLSSLNLQTILVGLIVILLAYKVRQRWKYRLPPGPFSFNPLGNIEVFKARFIWDKYKEYAEKYGPVFKIRLGPMSMVILNDINVVTEALVKKGADFAGRPQTESLKRFTNGKDIVFADYSPRWKLHRRIAGKAIRHYMAGKRMENVVHASARKCLAKMAEQKGQFDPEPYIGLLVFNILNAVCNGESCEFDDPVFRRLMKIESEMVEEMKQGFIEDIVPYLANICPTKRFKKTFSLLDEIFDFMWKKFKEHEDTFDPDNIRDFTDTLILARKEAEQEENDELLSQLTRTHLVMTLFNIFGAGVDTTRMTLYYILRILAGFQDIQNKIHEEIDKVVGRDRLPGIEDRDNLPFCEATLYEVLRLGVAAPLGVPHTTICDTQVGGYDIPKGTMVIINIWALHHNPNYWKDPEKFDPTRYLDENGKVGMKPANWLPFSAGRRVCLGEMVVKPELHLILAIIFQRFRIKLPEGTKPEMELAGSGGSVQPAPFEIIVEER